jgi:hypothetical protein
MKRIGFLLGLLPFLGARPALPSARWPTLPSTIGAAVKPFRCSRRTAVGRWRAGWAMSTRCAFATTPAAICSRLYPWTA